MTSHDVPISGGYIIMARKLLASGIMEKPSLFLKLWIWMLMKASHKKHGNLKRGQFRTNIDEMRGVMAYKIGYRIVKPSRKEIRDVYEFLTKDTMIVTTKVTHGLLITILNYDYFQNPQNYEGQYEGQYEGHNEGHTEKPITYENKTGKIIKLNHEGHDEGSSRGTIKTRRDTRKEYSCNSNEFQLANFLLEKIRGRKPDFKEPDLYKWAKDIDLMIQKDKRTPEKIKKIIALSQADGFWQNNILSPGKLRKQFDQLELKLKPEKTNWQVIE